MCWWNFYFLLCILELIVFCSFIILNLVGNFYYYLWIWNWKQLSMRILYYSLASCGSNTYQIQKGITQYVVWPIKLQCCPMMVETVWQSMSIHIIYPPPLRFSHLLILYFNSFFYLVEDSYFSFSFFIITSSLGWSFLICIIYFLKN